MDRFRSILVPTDFSALSEAAAQRAAMLARVDGASIHLLHAVGFPVIATSYEISVPAAIWDGIREAASGKLESQRKSLEEQTGLIVTSEISDARDAVQAIADAAESQAADLVVMGTHGHGGFRHAFLGSVAERSLRTLDRPVLAVKEDAATAAAPIERILLAVDFSSHSDAAVEMAGDLAERLSASVEIVHAFDLPPGYNPFASKLGMELLEKIEANATGALASIQQRLETRKVTVDSSCRRGHPSVVIAEAAAQSRCELIVMGTRGSTGLAHVLLGSVAERTLRSAPCSVLAVQAKEQ